MQNSEHNMDMRLSSASYSSEAGYFDESFHSEDAESVDGDFSIAEDSVRSRDWFSRARSYGEWMRIYDQFRHEGKRFPSSDKWASSGKVYEPRYWFKPRY